MIRESEIDRIATVLHNVLCGPEENAGSDLFGPNDRDIERAELFIAKGYVIVNFEKMAEWLKDCHKEYRYHASPHRGCVLR